MNKVILIGRLTRDPEVRYSQSAEPVAICKFSIAVNRRFKRDGESDADFINCVALGKTGEFVEKYFNKGKKIGVIGRLSVRTYDDQGGQKRTWTEVVVEEAEFVESKSSGDGGGSFPTGADDYYADIASKQDKGFPNAAQNGLPQAGSPGGFSEIDNGLDDEELPF